MTAIETTLLSHHQIVTDRFVAACQTDVRIAAAFLGGSYASGNADAWSDLDLYLITTDEAYEPFLADKESFIHQLGDPLYLEDWGTPHCYFFIFAGGTEGELGIGRVSNFQQIHGGAYKVLVDKQSILNRVKFPLHQADAAEQLKTLRQLIMDFWHEFAHFNKALAREQLWFAYGSLEELRSICINLARLRHNFADPDVGDEPYWKIDLAMPTEQLAPLRVTFCPLEKEALRLASVVILQFYRDIVTELTAAHALYYPVRLEQLIVAQMEK